MIKRIISVFITCLLLAFSLIACSGGADNTDTKAQQKMSENDTKKPDSDENGKTLVAYFSATGTTESVAKVIAKAADADLFKIEPKEPYSEDDLNWNDDDSRVCIEHNNPDNRKVELVSTTVPDWESYSTIYIGYPIWWGIAAWPVDTFITENDFTGKTVIPFCTSASSGLGESGKLLEEKAGTGNWLEGKRFSSLASESDITSWVAELNQ